MKNTVGSAEKTSKVENGPHASNGSLKSSSVKGNASDYYITPDEVRQRTQHLSDN